MGVEQARAAALEAQVQELRAAQASVQQGLEAQVRYYRCCDWERREARSRRPISPRSRDGHDNEQAKTQSEAALGAVGQAQQQATVMQNFAKALETQLSEERVFRCVCVLVCVYVLPSFHFLTHAIIASLFLKATSWRSGAAP